MHKFVYLGEFPVFPVYQVYPVYPVYWVYRVYPVYREYREIPGIPGISGNSPKYTNLCVLGIPTFSACFFTFSFFCLLIPTFSACSFTFSILGFGDCLGPGPWGIVGNLGKSCPERTPSPEHAPNMPRTCPVVPNP